MPNQVDGVYFTPCPIPSCPAYEPNSIAGEYSQPFRHIQYKRTPSLRPMATLAMLWCRRIAKWRYRRRQSGWLRTAACAASTSKKRNKELPCLVMCPSRCLPPLEILAGNHPHVVADLLASMKSTWSSNDQHVSESRKGAHAWMGH